MSKTALIILPQRNKHTVKTGFESGLQPTIVFIIH